MPTIPQAHSRISQRHRGVALIIMLLLMVLGLTAVLAGSLNLSAMQRARQEKTTAALAQAKDALIGYAITYADTHSGEVHGYLPCPDINGKDLSGNPAEGSAKATCGNKDISTMGRLPWRTLGLAPLRDGAGECLWYAVSGNYKSNPKTGLMNWDTKGKLQLFAADGTALTAPDNQGVAIIFAPGAALPGQIRPANGTLCGDYSAANYLDHDIGRSINNADIAAEKFIRGAADGQVNDGIIFITRQDVWNAIQKRTDLTHTLRLLSQRLAECLADYGRNNTSGNFSLPWPAPTALNDYALNSHYGDQASLFMGRIPYDVSTSNSKAHNNMNGAILMTAANGLACPAYAASPVTELHRLYPWWDNWKDQLFYVLSAAYRPQSSATTPCSGNCVTVNGQPYAAAILFSGPGLAALGQTRVDRSTVSHFLEASPAGSIAANGSEAYQSATAGLSFNDFLFCIDQSLAVVAC
jgi:type II secretory pathway pseudopilin PulG